MGMGSMMFKFIQFILFILFMYLAFACDYFLDGHWTEIPSIIVATLLALAHLLLLANHTLATFRARPKVQ